MFKNLIAINTLRKNVLSNYIGTFTLIVCPIISLPFYLDMLGATIWGLVAFMITLQTFLSLVDSGLSQALLREFAALNGESDDKQTQLGKALLGFERVYWGFGLIASTTIILLSGKITEYWLNLNGSLVQEAQQAVIGAGLIFLFQFPSSVYRSLLLGTQHQVLLNTVITISTIFRQLGGVIVIFIWPTLLAYITWHLCCVILDTIIKRIYAWQKVKLNNQHLYWDSQLMRALFNPVLHMSIATIIGALTVQIDKIFLSGMISVERFGYYVIASSVATGILQVIYPVVNATIPYAISFKHDPIKLRAFNFRYAKFVIFSLLALASTYTLIGKQFLQFWLVNDKIAGEVYYILNYLLIGTLLNSLYTIGYINWVIQGHTLKIFRVNLIALITSIICVPLLISKFGLVGACFGWIMINCTGLLLSLHWLRPQTKIN